MTTYALFIATDPHPVSEADWDHLDQVYDRARLSSGGTIVKVRSTEGSGEDAAEFDRHVATFINGIHLEIRDEGPEAFSYLGDGHVIGKAERSGEDWTLTNVPADHVPAASPVAVYSAAGHSREEAEVRFGPIVEDWLS